MQLQIIRVGKIYCIQPKISTEKLGFFWKNNVENLGHFGEVCTKAMGQESKGKMHACVVVTNDEEERISTLAQPLLGFDSRETSKNQEMR